MMTTTTAAHIHLDLASSEEWPESDEAHRAAVEAELQRLYPEAEVVVTVGDVSSRRVSVWGPGLEDEMRSAAREVSEDMWDAMCSDPEAFGL